MALSTARIHRVRGRPPLLAAGIKSLIHSHSSSVRSLGYIFSFIYPFYTTREDFSDRLSGDRVNKLWQVTAYRHGAGRSGCGAPGERAIACAPPTREPSPQRLPASFRHRLARGPSPTSPPLSRPAARVQPQEPRCAGAREEPWAPSIQGCNAL